MKHLTLGIEIEVVASRRMVAELIQGVVGGCVRQIDEDTYRVGEEPNHWDVTADESIDAVADCQTEVVSPVLKDVRSGLGLVKRIAEVLLQNGVRVNESCGLHIHVGIPNEDRACVAIIPLIMGFIESRVYRSFAVEKRRTEFAAPLSPDFVERLQALEANMTPENVDEILTKTKRAWYGAENPQGFADRFDKTRYRGLNIHSYFYRGTIEFRYFNSTLNPEEIERCVNFSLGVAEIGRALVNSPEEGNRPESGGFPLRSKGGHESLAIEIEIEIESD